jgi:hypothetical protein
VRVLLLPPSTSYGNWGVRIALAEASLLRSPDPRNAIRLVLRGARSVVADAEPTAPGMPSFGRQIDDDQVAAVLTNARNAGDSPRRPLPPQMCPTRGKKLRSRTD